MGCLAKTREHTEERLSHHLGVVRVSEFVHDGSQSRSRGFATVAFIGGQDVKSPGHHSHEAWMFELFVRNHNRLSRELSLETIAC